MATRNERIYIGSKVFCIDREYYSVRGVVVKQYYPTASEQQTMIECSDGRLFHAPTRLFRKVVD